MTLASVLSRGRSAAEARMTSRCSIYRDAGKAAQNNQTGKQARLWSTIHVDLPCRVSTASGGSAQHQTLSVPSGAVEVPLRTLSLPWGTEGIADGDLVEVTSGECVGLFFQVVEAATADQRTALRLPVIGVRRPEGWTEEESS